ncbi:hypothetical protein RD110_15405 [Rhodoferax koreense]|uniref:Lipoprotein n=1 Tax=Rhodoferax koreensis TaxID=1842727 RepID=A0A1P8JXD2_9BURK|nr:hypothetical protein [Rhodoferax koreense]APW38410.1 hypothetical protein RD110_15405 [Rhodoferax koreense]
MKTRTKLALLTAASLLAACGGGSGGGAEVAAPAPAPAPETSMLSLTVIDGPLSGAKVCLDLNGNGACDADEPFGTSTAGGAVSFPVLASALGKYPVVAEVPVGAIDEDDPNTPVATAYRLTAPVSNPVISPLTTLVQQMVSTLGLSPAAAADTLQAQAGLSSSPLANYVAAATADAQSANAARILVAAIQSQTVALGSSADIQKAILANATNLLTAAVLAGSDASVADACGDRKSAACKSAIASAVGTVVADAGLTPATAAAAVSLATAPAVTESSTPVASFSLDWVNAGDTANWYTRIFTSTAAEATPDANGLTRYRSIRHARVAGVDTIWNINNDPARAGDLHWSGTAWVGCTVDFQNTSTVRDAQGRSSYNNCDGRNLGTTQRVTSDISSRSMADIFALIQSTRTDGGNWGKAPTWFTGAVTASVGTATFPAESRLISQTDTTTATAIGYDVRTSNIVTVADADVAAGGNATVNRQVACNVSGNNASQAVTLETMIARNPGTPCIYNQQTDSGLNGQSYTSLTPNEGWGNTTTSMGTLGNAPVGPGTTAGFYTTNTRLRVSFAGGSSNATTYYTCLQRASNDSTRNCTVAGTGTYTITTLGDGRVMTFSGLPTKFAALSYERVFVERGGQVYWGFKDRLSTVKTVRLNGTAGNAVLSQLGLPTFTP